MWRDCSARSRFASACPDGRLEHAGRGEVIPVLAPGTLRRAGMALVKMPGKGRELGVNRVLQAWTRDRARSFTDPGWRCIYGRCHEARRAKLKAQLASTRR
jgi:hypothetical protein